LADILWTSNTTNYWEQHPQEQNKITTEENFRDADGMLYLRM